MSRLQQSINDYWTAAAPAYDAHQQRPDRRPADVDAWSRVWSAALPPAPAAVLDVGTGSGHVACLVAGLGYDVTGIDLSGGMLDLAREHAARLDNPPRIMEGDAVDPAFAPASFDAVVGRYVTWTLRDPDAAVASWVRLLRPGGVVAMVDSTWFADGLDSALYGDRPDGHLPLADATSIEATADALRRGGLADVTVTPLGEILELDRTYGVAPGHDVQVQYLLTGRV
jgi:SAM-dependent methyltransferase